MKNCLLFLVKALHTPQILLSAALLFLISFFAFGYADLRENLPCAIVSEDNSDEAGALLEYLTEYDFVVYDSREEAEAAVSDGSVDCAAVISDGLLQRMSSGDMEGVCDLMISDRTAQKDTYSLLLCAAILQVYAPCLTQNALASQGYPLTEEQTAEYFARAESEITPLQFQVIDVEGNAVSAEPTDLLPVGLIAISAFLLYGFLSIALVRRRSESVRIRFTSPRDYCAGVLLPRLLPVGFLLTCASCVGILCGHIFLDFDLLPLLAAVIGYFAALTILLTLLMLLPASGHFLTCAVGLDAAVSLILCPLYLNIALILPGSEILRVISIPFLLYLLRDHPALVPAVLLLSAALLLLLLSSDASASVDAPRRFRFRRRLRC